jgi:hypothetical protein
MTQTQVKRFTAISGIVSVLLYALGDALTFNLPPIGATAHAVASFAAGNSTQLLIFVYVWGATVAVTIGFLTGLWSLLRHHERAGDVLPTLALGAGFMIWAIVLAGLAPVLALGYRAASLDVATAKLLSDLALLGATLSAFPTVVSVGAFSMLILRTRVVAPWIGWFGFVVVAAHLIAAGAFAQAGFFSPSVVSVFVAPPLYFAWVLFTSLALLPRSSNK